MNVALKLLGILVIAAPFGASAEAPHNFLQLSNLLILLLNNVTSVLIVAGIAIYFYGVSTNILKFSEKGGEMVRTYFLWGIIVLFVMVSIWGIIGLIQNTIFSNNPYAPATTNTNQQNAFGAPVFNN